MKKIIALFCLGVFSGLGHADTLQCKQSYDFFYQNIAASKHFVEAGDLDAYIALSKKNSYSQLFQSQHLGQVYVSSKWIAEQDNEDNLKSFIQNFVDQPKAYQLMEVKYKAPKVNLMTDVGEVCVVPTQEVIRVSGNILKARFDTVFVRTAQDNQWRTYAYSGDELIEDLNTFFPGFLQQLQLSQKKINGLNIAEQNRQIVVNYYQHHGLAISDALRAYLQREYLDTKQRLQANGHDEF